MSKVDEMIARTRELDAAATPGPWEQIRFGDFHQIKADGEVLGAHFWMYANGPKNAALAAEYRTLAPKLADMLERAMEELGSVRASASFRIRQDAADAIDEIEAMAEGGES